jgi:AcrR family transcriptional regulator/DNA-binding MarR family transcriptional regulator
MHQQGNTGREMHRQHAGERGSSRTTLRAAALAQRTPTRLASRSTQFAARHEQPTRSAARPEKLAARPRKLAARHNLHSAEVIEIQRTRLLAGALAAIEEHGWADTTVARITTRARVSRRTFYQLFADREACLAALAEYVVGLLEAELAQAGVAELSWRERVRGGLQTILMFCDREPALARVCVVHALRGGPQLLASRAEVLTRLSAVIDEGRAEGSRMSDCSPLTAEGLVGAVFAIVHARLVRGQHVPLTDLLGELTSMVMLPYLGAAAAQRERARPAPLGPPAARPAPHALALSAGDPLQGLPMRLTYRTARVLGCIAARPGVSNREVADHAGVADQGQISKLLRRLERLGLTVNSGEGYTKGEPNAWELTPLGQQVTQRLRMSRDYGSAAA